MSLNIYLQEDPCAYYNSHYTCTAAVPLNDQMYPSTILEGTYHYLPSEG